MIIIKKLIIFILILIAFLLPSWLFPSDITYYQSLNLPQIAPDPKVFSIWFILYLLIAYVIANVVTKYKDHDLKDFLTVFAVNYIMNILFTPLFFGLESPLVGFAFSVGVFITAIFLLIETRKFDKNLSWFLLPYVLWSLFATILSFSILLLN
ncbi:TspO/MBR family protein [Mycoplasmatota bacterium WC44]